VPDHTVKKLLIALLLTGSSAIVDADGILRDPTRPFVARVPQTSSAPRYKVDAIFISAKRSIAVLNGERVRVGDQVGAATVIAIEKSQLILNINGKQITAKLKHGAIR